MVKNTADDTTTPDKHTGKVYQNLRKAACISGWEAAAAVDCSQARVSLFEAGHRPFSPDELDRLEDYILPLIEERWSTLKDRQDFQSAVGEWLKLKSAAVAKTLREGQDKEANTALHATLDSWREGKGFSVPNNGLETVRVLRVEGLRLQIKAAEKKLNALKQKLARLEDELPMA